MFLYEYLVDLTRVKTRTVLTLGNSHSKMTDPHPVISKIMTALGNKRLRNWCRTTSQQVILLSRQSVIEMCSFRQDRSVHMLGKLNIFYFIVITSEISLRYILSQKVLKMLQIFRQKLSNTNSTKPFRAAYQITWLNYGSVSIALISKSTVPW